MSDPFDPFVLQTYSRRDRQKLERLHREASELGPAAARRFIAGLSKRGR